MCMSHTDGSCPDERIKAELEKLYLAILEIAPYVARCARNPKVTGQDALHTAIMRMLEMEDKLKQSFLERPEGEKKGYCILATKNNVKQEMRWDWRFDSYVSSEGTSDKTIPDHAEEVANKDAVIKALQSLPKQQREVMELVREGFIAQEIAQKLKTSAVNVRQQMFKARKTMQKSLHSLDTTP